MRHPGLRRAGWALVMTTEHGELISACFGAVPFDLAPAQTSRDGEDYAIFMASFVAEPPFTILCDCAGTVGCMQVGGRQKGLQGPRAHLWSRVYSAFDGEQAEVVKTLAHATAADVLGGKTTWWEKKGNSEADKFAKRGCAMHPMPQDAIDAFHGLAALAREAARWAGQQEAWLFRKSLRDTEGNCSLSDGSGIPEGQTVAPDGDGGSAGGGSSNVVEEREDDELEIACSPATTVNGHYLRKCRVTETGERLITCVHCGMYFWKSQRGLSQVCKGAARITPAGRTQLARIAAGLFPKFGPRHVSALEAIDLDTVVELREMIARHCEVQPQSEFVERWARPSSVECLKCFGASERVLDEIRQISSEAHAGQWVQSGEARSGVAAEHEYEPEDEEGVWFS